MWVESGRFVEVVAPCKAVGAMEGPTKRAGEWMPHERIGRVDRHTASVRPLTGGATQLAPVRARHWLLGALLVSLGCFVIAASCAYVSQETPIIVYGLQSDLGTLSKGEVAILKVKFLNATAQPILVITEAPGCTTTGNRYERTTVAPFGRGSLDYTLETSRLKLGHTEASIVIHAVAGGRQLRLVEPIHFNLVDD